MLGTTSGIEFNNDDHGILDLSCNIFAEYSEFGVLSNNTNLANIGNGMMSAGNVFQKVGGTPANFIQHTGNAPTYYVGPLEVSMFPAGVMNITQSPAQTDNMCAVSVVAAFLCKSINFVGVDEINANPQQSLEIFPNPSTGRFTLFWRRTP